MDIELIRKLVDGTVSSLRERNWDSTIELVSKDDFEMFDNRTPPPTYYAVKARMMFEQLQTIAKKFSSFTITYEPDAAASSSSTAQARKQQMISLGPEVFIHFVKFLENDSCEISVLKVRGFHLSVEELEAIGGAIKCGKIQAFEYINDERPIDSEEASVIFGYIRCPGNNVRRITLPFLAETKLYQTLAQICCDQASVLYQVQFKGVQSKGDCRVLGINLDRSCQSVNEVRITWDCYPETSDANIEAECIEFLQTLFHLQGSSIEAISLDNLPLCRELLTVACRFLCSEQNQVRKVALNPFDLADTSVCDIMSQALLRPECKVQNLSVYGESFGQSKGLERILFSLKRSCVRQLFTNVDDDVDKIKEMFPEDPLQSLSKLLVTRWYEVTLYVLALATLPRFKKNSLAAKLMTADTVRTLMSQYLPLQYSRKTVWRRHGWCGNERPHQKVILTESFDEELD